MLDLIFCLWIVCGAYSAVDVVAEEQFTRRPIGLLSDFITSFAVVAMGPINLIIRTGFTINFILRG